MSKLKYFLIMLVIPVILYAQDKDYSREPGYVDFGDFSQFEKEDNVTEVYLDENLLQMVSKMSKGKDSAAAELISGLKLIKVNVFQVDKNNAKGVQNKISELDKKLTSKNWNRIVKVREKGEAANIYIKQDSQNNINGLVVTTFADSGEAVFVNIVGPIDMEQIGQLGDKFNIPSVGHINK